MAEVLLTTRAGTATVSRESLKTGRNFVCARLYETERANIMRLADRQEAQVTAQTTTSVTYKRMDTPTYEYELSIIL